MALGESLPPWAVTSPPGNARAHAAQPVRAVLDLALPLPSFTIVPVPAPWLPGQTGFIFLTGVSPASLGNGVGVGAEQRE